MAYQVLARKYRPQLFSDVIGQDHVTRTLLNALAQNRIAHGYIFSGHRGIGKTTIARILAAALNCENTIGSPERPTPEPCRVCTNCREISAASRQESDLFEESSSFDVEEIDSATHRGIDDARLLTAKIQTRPTNKSKYRILILDEAHQITDAAWNALLKTLEEPPAWAVFMFATTQPEDIPQTIRSRCQHFSFHAVKLDDIVGQLRSIATKENLSVDDATLTLLAEAGDGSMRDALSIMDQAIASAPTAGGQPSLEVAQVRELMGTVSNVVYEQIMEAVHAGSGADVLGVMGRLLDAGNGPAQLARQFVRYLRNCVVAKITGLTPTGDEPGAATELLQISPEERQRAARSAANFTEEELSRFLSIMLRTFDELGYRQEQRFHLELGLLKLVHVQRLVPVEVLLSQLGGATSAAKPAAATPRAQAPAASTPVRAATPAAAPPSPFEADRSRKIPTASASQPIATTATTAPTAGSLALDTEARPAVEAPSQGPQLVVTPPVVAASSSVPSLADLQAKAVAALSTAKGQSSAADKIEEAGFALEGGTLIIQTTLSKTMLPVVINAEAERILTVTAREHGVASRVTLLPGAAAAIATPKVIRAAASGSAAELAEKHPIVQQARQLFNAEISNVIDLRGKD